MNIYVGNLNYRIQEEELKEALEAYGEVEFVKIIKDRQTGRSKGFGFIEMPNENEARTAIEELSGVEFHGRQLVIKEAIARD